MPVSPRTQQAYLACVRQWAEHFNTAPDLITAEQLRQYFIHLKCIKKVARQTSTQTLCAIKLFWEKTLRRICWQGRSGSDPRIKHSRGGLK